MGKAKKVEGSLTADYDYETAKVRGKDGKVKHTRTNGDAIAKAMLRVTSDEVSLEKVIKDNGLGDKFKPAQYDNRGLLRMSVGNSLRALVRNGTHVTIGDLVIKSLEQRVAVPEVKDAASRVRKPRKPRAGKMGDAEAAAA